MVVVEGFGNQRSKLNAYDNELVVVWSDAKRVINGMEGWLD